MPRVPHKSPSIRTLVIDTTRMNSQLLAESLRRDRLIDVVAVAVGYAEGRSCVVGQKPDVAVISSALDGDSQKGLELCQELSHLSSATRVIILLDSAVQDNVAAAFRFGAKGVFFRDGSVEPLAKCIRCVHDGQIWATNRDISFVLQAFARSRLLHANCSAMGRLSERERQVAACVCEGLSNRDISERLKVSEHTVKNYIFHIFDKLGISNRVELILYTLGEVANSMPSGSNAFSMDDAALARYYQETVAREVGVLQYRLAEMYRAGHGVPRDKVLAYVWFRLAERECSAVRVASRLARKTIERDMSQEELRQVKEQLTVREQSRHVPSFSKSKILEPTKKILSQRTLDQTTLEMVKPEYSPATPLGNKTVASGD